jgi:hypothetical protein
MKYLSFLFALFISLSFHAQDEPFLELSGFVADADNGKKLDGVNINIIADGTSESNFYTDGGKYYYQLKFGKNYMVVYSRTGYVTKKLNINTNGVPPEKQNKIKDLEIEMTLFEKIQGMDYSLLNQPIGKSAYNGKDEIAWDFAYTSQMNQKIDALIAEYKKKKLQEEAKEQAYKEAMSNGDMALLKKDFPTAKSNYEKALSVKPGDEAATKKLETLKAFEEKEKQKLAEAEAKKKAEEEAQRAKEEAEKEAQRQAELAKQKELEAINNKYKELITKADNAFNSTSYDEAILHYKSSLEVKPDEAYPKDKIAQAEAKKAELAAKAEEQKKLEEQYKTIIADADKKFFANELNEAKTTYQEASKVKPDEAYPKNQIKEIDNKLAQIAAKEQEEKAKKDKYAQLVKDGDLAMNSQNYKEAKTSYQSALGLFANETYPKEKVLEIDKILAEKAAKEKAAAELEANYNKLIAEGDKLFSANDLVKSKSSFQQALQLKPEEAYPKNKIEEIDAKLSELAVDEKYNSLIKEADRLLASKNLEVAKQKYEEALTIKQEDYPQSKIGEINAELEKLAQLEKEKAEQQKQYNDAIARADKSFAANNLEEAKSSYQEALEIFPKEAYPKQKIAEIEKIMADQLAKSEAEKAINEKYNSLITQADESFENSEYQNSISKYKEALTVKPNESYPKSKINEIESLLDEMAKEKLAQEEAEAEAKRLAELEAKKKAEEEAKKAADLAAKEEAAKKAAELEAQRKAEEEAKRAAELAANKASEQEKQKALEAQKAKYNKLVEEADNFFTEENYTSASDKYWKALEIFPDEQYPKDQILVIEQKQKEMDLAKQQALEEEKRKADEEARRLEAEARKKELEEMGEDKGFRVNSTGGNSTSLKGIGKGQKKKENSVKVKVSF